MTSGDAPGVPPLDPPTAADLIARADLQAARRAVSGVAARTPTLACAELTALVGSSVALKAECLQGTGSFKLRGALSKVAALGERASAGLVTASAGNHARAVAQAARVRGVACEVFMPRDAAVSKVAAVHARAPRARAPRSCTHSTTWM
jgi:threonine dehydratase